MASLPLDRQQTKNQHDLDANGARVQLLHCSGEWTHTIRPLPTFEPRKALVRGGELLAA